MKKLTPDDPQTHSADVVAHNVERLRELFPEAFTEGRVDFDVLKQLLSGVLEERDEKYGLNWHGKRRARQLALTPSTGTLRPCPEESVDWDRTKNLMIEGDNLEVLKLLQKSYNGKVKLIYIDPPYNTGKDFVYPDDFRDNVQNYLYLTGQLDDDRKMVSSNTEASGRFHTDWLNMLYPRVALARHLLSQEGVLFVSIGESEAARLQLTLEELFGEENCLGRFVWTYKLSENQGVISSAHEYILAFAKNRATLPRLRLTGEDLERLGPEISDATFRAEQRKNPISSMTVPAGVRSERGGDFVIPKGKLDLGVASITFESDALFSNGRLARPVRILAAWTMKGQCEEWFAALESGDKNAEIRDSKGQLLLEVFFEASGRLAYRKKREQQSKVSSHLSDQRYTYVRGRTAVEALFDGRCPFSYPKPVALLQRLVELASGDDDVILDFFAGSGTTAQAVMAANAADGGSRQFILVQLPEQVHEGSEAARLCSLLDIEPHLAALCAERVRRAGSMLASANSSARLDAGFRVFRLDHSNVRAWDPTPMDLEASLFDVVDNLREGRSAHDILYEVLLKLGLDLSVPTEKRTIARKAVYSIGAGTLFVCLPTEVTGDEIEELTLGIAGWRDALKTAGETTVVFRDSAFADDVAKTNASAILEQHGIENVLSL